MFPLDPEVSYGGFQFVQALNRPLNFAVVDEVDSILIDEARNPFIVNMPGTDTGFEQHWMVAVQIAMQLQGPPVPENMNAEDLMHYFDGVPMEEFMNVDFIPDFRIKGTTLTRRGMAKCVKLLAHPHVERVFVAQDVNGIYHCVILDLDVDESYEDRARSGSSGRLIIREIDGKLEGDAYVPFQDDSEASYELENASRDCVVDTLERIGLVVMPSEEVREEVWDAAIPSVLWSGGSKAWGRFINQATRAVHAFHKNVDYIVRGGEIVVIDSATGRERDRSRWQAGLHQALEAKELYLQSDFDLKIRPEDFDQGRITYQVLFSEYQTLSGMTGTAATEAEEFEEAYGLPVVRIPPHKPSMRVDESLEVYGSKVPWSQRILDIVKQAVRHGRPVLIGTMTVEASEEVHRIISNAPFDIRLNETDELVMASALSKVPKKLPLPPNIKQLGDQTSTELKSAYIFYQGLMTDYDDILSYLNECVRSKAEVSLQQSDVRHVMTVLRHVVSSKAWSLKNSTELDAVEEIYETLEHSVRNSALSKSTVINLLNARPERARKEAEIIAQAGLPGTITVATSMAGRGTDILLGGNPKGLALSALKFLYGNIFVSEEEQGCFQDIPLSKSHPAFIHGERSMKTHLPLELFECYVACRVALSGPQGPSTTMSENEASSFFEKVVEKTEIIRSHMKISLQHQLKNAGDGYLSIFGKAFDAGDEISELYTSQMLSELDLEVPHEKYNTLIKFSLLQWLWFDRVCAELARGVRSSGGLCVVIASIPESRRAELQLRGRAGRQGDPGTTSIIASLEDPILSAALLPNQQRDIWNYIEESGSSNDTLPSLVINPIIKTVIRNQEQLQQGGRDVSRKYDAVIDSYRRHVYRLRRIITRGGETSRASLLNSNLRDTAADIVQANCDAESGIKDWDIEATIDDLMSLLQQPALMHQASHETPRVSGFKNPENVSISIHVLDEFLMAFVEEIEADSLDTLPLHMQVHKALQARAWDTIPTLNFKNSSISMTSTRRRAILSVRSNLKSPQNAHDALVLWAGDVLTSVYEAKRHACHEALTCSELTNAPLNAFQSNAIVRVWERDIALACIDSLWSDFLQDVTVLQAASQSRAFSMFDPVDEFRLEAATAFSRLLREYSHIVSSKLLGPVDLLHLGYLESSGTSRSHAARQHSDREDISHVLKLIKSS